jgi:hypothetical protein
MYILIDFLLQTLQFCIKLLVRDTLNVTASTFRFRSILEIENAGIVLYEDDVLHDFVTRDS